MLESKESIEEAGSLSVLRMGIRTTPAFKRGLGFTFAMALGASAGRLVVPILIQQILDRGLRDGYRPRFILAACGLALLIIAAIVVLNRMAFIRLLVNAQAGLRQLRVAAFEHIHRLSMADHNDAQRGQLTARVTSDVEQLANFVNWGVVNWVVSSTMIVGTLTVMAIWSWQLTLVVLVIYAPVIPYARWVQGKQLAAYSSLRDRVGDTLTDVSGIVMGAPVIRAYSYRERMRERAHAVAKRHYRAQMSAQRFFSLYLPVTDIVGGLSLALTLAVGVWFGPGWGMQPGELVAFLFLVSLFLNPITSITEVLDMTQTTMASWRKVLAVLAQPIEIDDIADGSDLPDGPLAVRATDVHFSYRVGPEVLGGVSVDIPAGSRVAVVGETGSGKTTFARLIARLADPTEGVLAIGGTDLTRVSGDSRRQHIRMVPQDGFLFDATVAENVAFGRDGATAADAREAFEQLDLGWWVDRLPDGIDSEVGERGDQLSVGERQLVALARAQLADPGLLILDEATSAVDPETEQALAHALDQVSHGRTTISIAHRLSTAEASDMVLVFDAGRLAEQGSHTELVAHGGIYAGLYASWLGNTRTDDADPVSASVTD